MPQFVDIATDSLRKIGAYAPGEIITDADIQQAFNTANDMLDSWSNESLTCYATLEQNVTLVPGVSSYTIGPGGSINGTRPLRLIGGPGAAYTLDTDGNKYPMEVVQERQRWNLLTSNNTVDADVPIYLWMDPQYPLAILNFWPVPNIGWSAYWDSYQQLVDFGSIYTPLNFPPGYKKAIQDCLAVELWPYFFKGDVPQTLLIMAAQSKGNVKRTNLKESIALYDPALVARGSQYYNIYTDNQNS